MAYLTFAEYTTMGGTLNETTFNQLAMYADTYIDWYTFNRLWGETDIPERVKQCEFMLIKLIKAKLDALAPQTDPTTGVTVGAQISSQSNDGVSVDYNILHADEVLRNCQTEIEDAIKRYLNGVMNSLDKKLLYRGLYPDE